MGVMMEMADAKILFHHVPDLGDGLVPLYLVGSQLSTPCCFSHNSVLDLIHAEKLAVLLSKISLVGKNFLNGILGMTTAGHAQWKKRTVMERGRGHFRGQDKSVTSVDRGMLFQAKVGLIVFSRPIRIEITGKLHRLARLVQASIGRFSFDSFFFQFFLAEGMAGRLYQTGVDSNAFVDG